MDLVLGDVYVVFSIFVYVFTISFYINRSSIQVPRNVFSPSPPPPQAK